MSTFPVYFARSAESSIVGTSRRTLRPLRSRNYYSCTKNYGDNDKNNDDDADDTVVVVDVDKDAGYDARTS